MSAHWVLTDVFGLTRLVPAHRWTGFFTVEPVPRPVSAPPPPAGRPGDRQPRFRGRRSGDPFDVRPYHPGDDLRRVHWPLLAHSGIPFVRTAEPDTPPSGRQFIVLDTDAASEEDLDLRLASLAGWLSGLGAQGVGWVLEIPSAGLTLIPGQAHGPALAALVPAPLADTPVPRNWPRTLTFLTGTSSGSAGPWTDQVRASGRRVETIEVPRAVLPAPAPQAWWRRRK